MRRAPLALALLLAAPTLSCGVGTILGRNGAALFEQPARIAHKVTRPYRPDARLAVLWIGHASTLLQLDDKLVLTDPVFTDTVGQLSKRLVEPGLDPAALDHVDAAVISHMHFDHLSPGSLGMIEHKLGFLVVPQKGTVCVPDLAFETVELAAWKSHERGGLRITAVPVRHSGFRWGIDDAWMDTSFTGYVIEYHGLTVYFGGDTAYARESFEATRRRFPTIDLAVLPIAPINPRALMESRHMDPREALLAFRDLGARWMVPVHFGTFVNSIDAAEEPLRVLAAEMKAQGVGEGRVDVLAPGEQRVLIPR